MILENAFNAAVPTAAAIAATGKVAVAKPGTIIGELVRLSAPVEILDGNGKQAATTTSGTTPTVKSWDSTGDYGWQVEFATRGTLENPSQHSLEMDGFVNDISKLVVQHVAHAKNVVRPLVTDFAEKLQTYLVSAKPKDAASTIEIRTLRMSALLKDESFLDTLSYYKDRSILSPDISFNLAVKTTEELQQLVMIGHDRSDKLVVEWLSHLPENFLSNVWNSFFTKVGMPAEGSSSVLYYEDLNRLNAFDKADHALAILLMARKITDLVQDSAISLTSYKNICTQYTDYAGALLVDALKKLDLAIRTKSIVIDKNPLTGVLCVNGEVYSQWLELGNSPEILMGLMISEGTATSQALIDEKKDEYLKQWNSYCTFFLTKELNASFSYAKAFIENEFLQSLKTQDVTEQDYAQKNSNFYNIVKESARTVLDNMKTTDLQDPYAIALTLVAKTRFFYTSSYQILSDINDASKANPNVDVREAALLAVINYVSDYVADQIALSAN